VKLGIAFDLGTSGMRAQAIELESNKVLATAITERHPLPGANVMDHLNFAIEVGLESAHQIIIQTINQVIDTLNVDSKQIARLAVSGNPIQLSLFEGITIEDLAYAGKNKKERLGITPPNRNAKVLSGRDFPRLNVPLETEIFIPPAVKHEIGADALAMLVKSGLLEKEEVALAVDYGTNAEMALKIGETILTASCAAGPALEGQHISHGMLAAPGAICNVQQEDGNYRIEVLDEEMVKNKGPLVSFVNKEIVESGDLKPTGITGTGVISLIYEGLENGFIDLPNLKDITELQLTSDITFDQKDLEEAGKAIGAIRAGYITLAKEAGIEISDIKIAYMAGASGTYVDAKKAQKIGMVPPAVEKICQIGNTSLAMANNIICNPDYLDKLQMIADQLRTNHCMLGESQDFKNAYLLELSYWGEGMSWQQCVDFLDYYDLPSFPQVADETEVEQRVKHDIVELGERNLSIISQVGIEKEIQFSECNGCGVCIEVCPEKALNLQKSNIITMKMSRCNGVACKRCEQNCPQNVYDYREICLE